MNLGVSGRLTQATIRSPLTPLFLLAALAMGLIALLTIPREEEPQISVPMVDVFSSLPGATPEEVDRRITEPLERRLWEISGVEHLYSLSGPSGGMTTVRFQVGDDPEESVVKVFAKLAGTPALVKLHTIDEVPILTLTFWGGGYEEYLLHQIAGELRDHLHPVAETKHRSSEVEQCRVGGGHVLAVDRVRPTRKDDPLRFPVPDPLHRAGGRMDLAVHMRLPHATRDELRELGSEVDDQDAVVMPGSHRSSGRRRSSRVSRGRAVFHCGPSTTTSAGRGRLL